VVEMPRQPEVELAKAVPALPGGALFANQLRVASRSLKSVGATATLVEDDIETSDGGTSTVAKEAADRGKMTHCTTIAASHVLAVP
jgi:hypothetical protein